MKKVSLAGGPVQTLMEVTAEVGPPTLSWGEDGNILITDNGVLKRISANGGNPVVLATAVAGIVPARRASRLDPLSALRFE